MFPKFLEHSSEGDGVSLCGCQECGGSVSESGRGRVSTLNESPQGMVPQENLLPGNP